MTHGTMLPSTIPLTMEDAAIYPGTINQRRHFGHEPNGGHIPKRVSRGKHQTKTKKNRAAAAQYAAVRQNHDLINNYWQTVENGQQ